MTADSRESALRILNTLDTANYHLDSILENDRDLGLQSTSMRERGLINAMVYGVLRWRLRIDWIIVQHSNIPLKKIRPPVLNILRLGVFQIFFLDRVPDSAAVNTSVEMTKKIAPAWVAGFVNGLLRNAVRKKGALPGRLKNENPTTTVSILKSFPEWLIDRWIRRYGPAETEKLCDAMNQIPPVTVRTNTLKTDRDSLFEQLLPEVRTASLTNYSPDGLFFSGPDKPIHGLSAFQSGLFQVQDEAAQLISYLLSPRPGEQVLDACAGLGGKTGHLAQLMKNQGRIIAADIDGKKLLRLNAEMERLGIDIVETKNIDLNSPPAENSPKRFDRILLDAPCSGLGVIRRNPDIKWDDSRKNLSRFAQRQVTLLKNAAMLLKPGGILVYAVCSLEPEENENVVSTFFKNRTNFEIIKDPAKPACDIHPFMDKKGFFRAVPHIHQTDGFFAVCLKRLR